MLRGPHLSARCLAVLLLALTACTPAAPSATAPAPARPATDPPSRPEPASAPATAAAPAAAAPTPATVRQARLLISTTSATIGPLWVAAEQGFFRRHGLEMELPAVSATAANQALTAGEVGLAVTGGASVTAWLGGATDLVFVAGLVNRPIFKIMGRPDVHSMDDLRGKSIGTSTAGTGAAISLLAILKRLGIQPDRDVSIVYLRDPPTMLGALVNGAVQAAVLSPPFTNVAQSQGANVVVDMLDTDLDFLANNITSTRPQIERDPDLVRRVVTAYVEATQFAREHPEETIGALMRGTQTDDRAEAEAAYAMYRGIWHPWPSEAGIQTYLDNTDLPNARTTQPSALIDYRFVRELQQSGLLTPR
jgi:NitT/TauT family transport system substrate-binding protein